MAPSIHFHTGYRNNARRTIRASLMRFACDNIRYRTRNNNKNKNNNHGPMPFSTAAGIETQNRDGDHQSKEGDNTETVEVAPIMRSLQPLQHIIIIIDLDNESDNNNNNNNDNNDPTSILHSNKTNSNNNNNHSLEIRPHSLTAAPPWQNSSATNGSGRCSGGGSVPRGFWKDPANHRRFFDWAAKQLGVAKHEDWYRVTRDDMYKLGGCGLISSQYKSSLVQALLTIYPEVDWEPWKFDFVPNGFWEIRANRRRFFDRAAKELAITRHEDWYAVSGQQIAQLGGGTLLSKYYRNSISTALADVYPEVEWHPWRFENPPRGIWNDPTMRRRFFDAWASVQLGIRLHEDWYSVRKADFLKLKGAVGVLSLYNSNRSSSSSSSSRSRSRSRSRRNNNNNNNNNGDDDHGNPLAEALMAVYPEYEWIPWLFADGPPKQFWEDPANRRSFFEWAAKQLNITQLDGWYSVSPSADIIARLRGGSQLLDEYFDGSLATALQRVYPEQDWLPWRFSSPESLPRGFWDDISNQRAFFEEWAARQLNVHHSEDWYRIRTQDVAALGGGSVLLDKYYGGSLPKALASLFPQVDWLPWRFRDASVPKGFWSDRSNHRRFFDWAAQQLGVQGHEGWYSISRDSIIALGGLGLLSNFYNNSLHQALAAVYPEVQWLSWRFVGGVPRGYWSDTANQKRFFDWAALQLGINKPEDWYDVKLDQIANLGGGSIVNSYYDSSLPGALAAIYPDVDWVPWRFAAGVPGGFWRDPANHHKFFEWAAKELGITNNDHTGWYAVSAADISRMGGAGLLASYYNYSISRALLAVYPHVDWQPWRFKSGVPDGFWEEPANQKAFFEWATTQLGIKEMEDWYSVSRADIVKLGGAGLLQSCFDGSFVKAIAHVYPSYNWEPWRFRNWSAGIDDLGSIASSEHGSVSELRRFMEHLARELGIEHPDDWYRASNKQLRKSGGLAIIARAGGLYTVLKRVYPEHAWDEQRFHMGRGKRSDQRWLKVALQKLFPGAEIIEEYEHPDITFQNGDGMAHEHITLDLWIPSLSLAFEYHGAHHYHDIHMFGASSKQQLRDDQKARLVKQAGITLITVPYWWDRTVEAIAAAIHELRPDLAPMLPLKSPPRPPAHEHVQHT